MSVGSQHFLVMCFQPFLVACIIQSVGGNDIVAFFFVHCSAGEGGEAFNKVLYEECPPQIQPLTLL